MRTPPPVRRQTAESFASVFSSVFSSVLYRALLACIDVCFRSRLEQESQHVAGQECPALRIHHVQAVMIDQHRLLLQPLRPAVAANTFDSAGSRFTGKGRALKPFAGLAASNARNCRRHFDYEAERSM